MEALGGDKKVMRYGPSDSLDRGDESVCNGKGTVLGARNGKKRTVRSRSANIGVC